MPVQTLAVPGATPRPLLYQGVVPGQRPGTAVPGCDSRDCQGSNRHNFLNTCLNGASEESIGIYVNQTSYKEVMMV